MEEKVSQGRIARRKRCLLENIRDTDVRVALIQALIPEWIKGGGIEKLQEEVQNLAGRKYQHGKGKRCAGAEARRLRYILWTRKFR